MAIMLTFFKKCDKIYTHYGDAMVSTGILNPKERVAAGTA